ncbi:MAG: TIGR02453 family protein [Bryobacterales bacterium]|nr:TIGR02453 family protein [Bryobacterales bacterium]
MGFPGFSNAGIAWLKALPENNNREWFEENKPTYETEVKAPMLALVTSLNAALVERMPEYFLDQPAKAIFRIYRDIRFSKNKAPYKTHLGAVFSRRGMGDKASGLYFQVSAEGVGIAGGAYMPPNDSLLAIRTRIASQFEEFHAILQEKKLRRVMGVLQGDTLSRPPKGFPADHPGIELLKKKQFYFWKELPPELLSSKKLESEILSHFLVMRSAMLFLDDAVLAKRRTVSKRMDFLS